MITKAKVTLTVEVTVDSSWGAERSIQQVFKDAREEAILLVKSNVKNCAIIGEPQVVAMTNTAEYGD